MRNLEALQDGWRALCKWMNGCSTFHLPTIKLPHFPLDFRSVPRYCSRLLNNVTCLSGIPFLSRSYLESSLLHLPFNDNVVWYIFSCWISPSPACTFLFKSGHFNQQLVLLLCWLYCLCLNYVFIVWYRIVCSPSL